MSHMQTIQDIFNTFKCPCTSYIVLKFGNVLPSGNRDKARNVILQRS